MGSFLYFEGGFSCVFRPENRHLPAVLRCIEYTPGSNGAGPKPVNDGIDSLAKYTPGSNGAGPKPVGVFPAVGTEYIPGSNEAGPKRVKRDKFKAKLKTQNTRLHTISYMISYSV